jgi:hypothetical protein
MRKQTKPRPIWTEVFIDGVRLRGVGYVSHSFWRPEPNRKTSFIRADTHLAVGPAMPARPAGLVDPGNQREASVEVWLGGTLRFHGPAQVRLEGESVRWIAPGIAGILVSNYVITPLASPAAGQESEPSHV